MKSNLSEQEVLGILISRLYSINVELLTALKSLSANMDSTVDSHPFVRASEVAAARRAISKAETHMNG
jgi:hypothetical protein